MRFLALLLVAIFLIGCVQETKKDDPDLVKSLLSKAIDTKNTSACDELGVVTNRCYNLLAKILQKPELCRPIDETYGCHPARSMPGVSLDPMCQMLEEFSGDGAGDNFGVCVAQSSNYKVEACAKINDSYESMKCIFQVTDNANLTNMSACSLLHNDADPDICKVYTFTNLCTLGTNPCTIDFCDSLNFSDQIYLDQCKLFAVSYQCEADINACSLDLCENASFNDAYGLSNCDDTLRYLRCSMNVSYCDLLSCDATYPDNPNRSDWCKDFLVEKICNNYPILCNQELCANANFAEVIFRDSCHLDVIRTNCKMNNSLCNFDFCSVIQYHNYIGVCGLAVLDKECTNNSSFCDPKICNSSIFSSSLDNYYCLARFNLTN